ncbi:MAG: tRNA guanosine(34) transglycosylase Tgt [Bacteroidetes bacterium]|jgi:queuine tRNA-ribosyltransferase|nr:tRNA guanosine(34) transglycosylase Tgt [Bacteroidota bacterium]
MSFTLETKDINSQARAGSLKLASGHIETPIFMPVGTVGTVKTVFQNDLKKDIDAPILLGNTYHLYLRPGLDILRAAGGLHRFMNWDRPILTDSGGYQVYSLAKRRKISEKGVEFQSHIDGSRHFFSPEKAIQIQRIIGADIIMAFDECPPHPCDYDYAKKSMELTQRWWTRCDQAMKTEKSPYEREQILAPIVQGSTYSDLREASATFVASQGAAINAIGGLSVGEPHPDMYAMTELCCRILPEESARYLMGVGTPANLLECISRGVDMFDCVLPTRNARHGMVYTYQGIMNIKNKKWEDDFSPLDEESTSPYSRQFSKAYVRHLFSAKETLGPQITSVHNLAFFLKLVRDAREQIRSGNFAQWKTKVIPLLSGRL